MNLIELINKKGSTNKISPDDFKLPCGCFKSHFCFIVPPSVKEDLVNKRLLIECKHCGQMKENTEDWAAEEWDHARLEFQISKIVIMDRG